MFQNRFIRGYFCRFSHNIASVFKTRTVGDSVTVQGWIKSIRNQKENVFIDISDGSSDKKLQIFIPKSVKPDNISSGSSIEAQGSLQQSPRGDLELLADKIEVIGPCVVSEGYPFAPRKEYTPEYIRQYLHFRTRTNKFASVLRVRNSANLAIHNYFNREGYINVQTPILTSNDCEGAGEVFKVVPESEELLKNMLKEGLTVDEGYFNRKVFLTVSGQLHLEAAAHGLSKVYTFGPTFRAENSKSRLHLSEFYMLEAEIAFLNDIGGLTEIIESLIKGITKEILDKNPGDVEKFGVDLSWLDKKFNVLSYGEALGILKDKFDGFDGTEGFGKEHELYLVDYLGNVPTFVVDWPKKMKSFYMRECSEDANKVSALDLLVPNVGELVGGSLRENNYEKLSAKMPPDPNLEWYLELRKFGGVPTGGFGLGFERYIQFILGVPNIKDVIPFPRWPHNCSL